MSQKYICKNRSIDCYDCKKAMPHDYSSLKMLNEQCPQVNVVPVEKDSYWMKDPSKIMMGKNSAWPSPFSMQSGDCLKDPFSLTASFKIDEKALKESLMNQIKEKEILSSLMKTNYDSVELQCLKAITIEYSNLIDEIRKSLGNITSDKILSTIESLKNCENCDVSMEAQCYPDGPCNIRDCRKSGSTWTGWRNPLAHAEDSNVIMLSKEEIEQEIKEEIE